jgi:uncharacterized alkaline shock family protein YloU
MTLTDYGDSAKIYISFFSKKGYNKNNYCLRRISMKGSMNTHMGNIYIDPEVIAQYAGSVAVECFGIVGMASVNVKDGLVKLLMKDSITHGISVSIVNNKLILDFHVIVSYGVSIVTVCDNLISSVKYKVENFTGLEIEKVNIYVEGVRVID